MRGDFEFQDTSEPNQFCRSVLYFRSHDRAQGTQVSMMLAKRFGELFSLLASEGAATIVRRAILILAGYYGTFSGSPPN